ncbi:MAG: 4-hydroxy-tetrahydrodipicolinate reductase [Defluviitaleaceae bacterium]|nr:4-hydroxy-tetrahydrodipicolinate reductase [Defluviitaleaceae bacterium]
MTRVIVSGCHGRLGAAICRLAAESSKNDRDAGEASNAVQVVAGIDVTAPPGRHAVAGVTSPESGTFPVFANISECDGIPADVLLICAPPHAADTIVAQARYCEVRKLPFIICTTALPADALAAIKKTADKTAVLISANLSLGVNLLAHLINQAAKNLYEANFDVEIIERHHNQKLDAPSGTAYVLADAVNTALGGEMRYITDRSPHRSTRARDEIGLHALRGGTITGDHSVIFAGLDEVIELKHSALSRDVFAVGALKAATFMHSRPPGLYTMQDVVT